MSEETLLFESRSARRGALLRLAVLVGVGMTTVALATIAVPQSTDPAWLRRQVTAFGPLAPLAFVCLQAVQVVVAPVPGQVLGGVAGFLFGTVPGATYSLLGVVVGSAIAFTVARRVGRPYLEDVLHTRTLARWDRFVHRNGTVGTFVLFVLPTFPDDLLCFAAGASEIRFRRFVLLVAVGRAPSFLVVAFAGGRLSDGALTSATAALTALALLSGAVLYGREQIIDTLART